MSAEAMVAAMNSALRRDHIDDQVDTVGQFIPRGTTGSMFAGGLVGDSVGGMLGPAGDAVGTVGGALAGAHGAARARGLPDAMVVGVSPTSVYGFAGRSRSREPHELVFRLPREGLTASVRGRVNVRVLTLQARDGSRIELEGNRLPVTHSKDVIDALRAR